MTQFLEAADTAVDGMPPLSDVAEYAYAAMAPPGARMVHVAGACPLGPDGRVTPLGDVRCQAARCLANLRQALRAAGSDLGDVVKTTVYVASQDRRELVEAWEVVREAFAPLRPPSTLLGVTVLGYPGQLVEIEAVAVVSTGASHPSRKPPVRA